MSPLAAAQNVCNKTSTMGWTDCLSTLHSDIAGALLCSCAFTLQYHRVTKSIIYHPISWNHLSFNVSWRWGLTDSALFSHFNLVYPQRISW